MGKTSRREKFPPKNFGKSGKLPVGKNSPQRISGNPGNVPSGKISYDVLYHNVLCFSIEMLSKRVL